MLSHWKKIFYDKKNYDVHVQYLGVLHDEVNMSVTTVHMVLSIIWRVLNLGWVHSKPSSLILTTNTSLCVSLCQWYNLLAKLKQDN
jgi:hypothetical protein